MMLRQLVCVRVYTYVGVSEFVAAAAAAFGGSGDALNALHRSLAVGTLAVIVAVRVCVCAYVRKYARKQKS